MAFLQLNLRLRCQSKILVAQLEILIWNVLGIITSLNLKLTRHQWELWINIRMKVNSITKFYLKCRYQSEIILAQSEATINILGFVINLILVWQHRKSYLKFKFINKIWDEIFAWSLRRYFTKALYTHLKFVYPEVNTKFRIK